MNYFLTEDTKAIILLCGNFAQDPRAKPLVLREYTSLVRWLVKAGLRPSALMDSGHAKEAALGTYIDYERLQRLMGRGAQLGFAVEKWHQSGIWVISRSDREYPTRYKTHLKEQAPPLLFGTGKRSLLCGGGLAIVGSRAVDQSGEMFTRNVAELCAVNSIPVVSGGAKGVDQISMTAALEAGGTVTGIIADNLLRKSVERNARRALADDRLLLISPYNPEARFTVGNAMGRNKLIYAMADYALVVSSDYNKGGTWAGATEELRRNQTRPVFVRTGEAVPVGNRKLLDRGALAWPDTTKSKNLIKLLSETVTARKSASVVTQQGIFDFVKSPAYEQAFGEDEVAHRELVAMVKEDKFQEILPSLYETVLPVILAHLVNPTTSEELATNLGVLKSQLNIWLKQAESEGKVEKLTRPVRYRKIVG